VSASTKNEDLVQISKAYKALSVKSLIITKIDESQTYGNILNLLMRTKTSVSYFTNGQAIPSSIEKASLEKLLELILNPGSEALKPLPPGKKAEIIPYNRRANSQPSMARALFVANNRSIHFHHPECAWAKKIRPENRIEFESIEEAVYKKYTPCKTCSSHILESRITQDMDIKRGESSPLLYSRQATL